MFSWDETKSRANLTKHGVTFGVARLVFEDPLHVSRLERVKDAEERWQTIGVVARTALLVAHTWQLEGEEGHEEIRIISARRATKAERKVYEQGA